jgi:phytoene dehydrogenase-like protein
MEACEIPESLKAQGWMIRDANGTTPDERTNTRGPSLQLLSSAAACLALSRPPSSPRPVCRSVEQLQLGVRGNVVYLNGGWQTIEDGLRGAAVAGGVRITPGAHAVTRDRS